ncbi:MAG: protein kinase [Candidatus Contendobacter sp.]|nr:protein kinase [Candidatus Contendobacter sp.]
MSFHRSPSDAFLAAGQGNGSPPRGGFVQIPGYEIECEIGRGGMATVYRAVQHSLGRAVAIKVLARGPDDQDEFALRFKKEGRILAQLLHPNIVTIYDIGVSEDNQLFLSMEYLSDGTLQDRIKRGLSFDSTIHIVRSIAKALGYAHEKGVIHRDVKPSNIMFRHDGAPVLTDFGVARVMTGSSTVHTMTGLTVGSPGYMSPEQARGQGATLQSDLYSLGVVLYEMLVGRPPYQADSALAVVLKHLHDPIPSLPREHANLQSILNKLLAKKSTDRYRDVGDFLAALNFVIPSDTGSQPKATTGGSPLAMVEFASGTLRSLWLKRPRRFLWMGMIGAAILLVVVVYAFRSRTATESSEALPEEPPQPVANTAPVSRETEIATLLQQAEARLQAGLLTDEAEQSADAAYRRVLKLDRGNAQALAGLENIAREYERLARQRLEAGAPRESLDPIQKGLAVAPGREGLLRLRQEAERRMAERQAQKAEQERQQELQLQAEQFLEQARSSFAEGLLEISQAHIEQGLLAVPDHPGLLALRERVRAGEAERQRQEEARRREAEAARRRTEEVNQYLAQALESRRNGGYAASLQQIDKGLALAPDHDDLLRLRDEVRAQLVAEQQRQAEQAKREQEIKSLLKQAEAQWKAKRLTEPAGDNAEATYQRMLQLDPDNAQARAGLERIAREYEQQARQRRDAGAPQESLGLIDKGLAVTPGYPGLLSLQEEISREIAEAKARQAREEEQQLQAELFLAQAQNRFQQGALAASLAQIEQGLGVMSGHPRLLSLREQVKARMAEQASQEAEAARRQEEEARRQAEEAERRKTEKARQQAAAERRRQEANQSLAQALEFQRKGDYAASAQLIEKGLEKVPNHEGLSRLREEVRAQLAAEQQRQAEQARRGQEIKTLLQQAEAHWKAKRFTTPPGSNAEATYRQVLELDAGNAQARAGLERIAREYLQQARQQQSAGVLRDSLELIEKGLAVAPNHQELLQLRQEVERGIAEAKARQAREAEQRLRAEQFLAQATSSFKEGALAASLAHIEQGLLAAPAHPGLLALREQVKARMAEQARQQAELAKRQEEEKARRQAEEEAERQKADQARQQAELAKRQEEADRYLARAVELQRKGEPAASLQQVEEGLALAPNHAELLRLREAVRTRLAAEQKQQQDQVQREQEIRKLLEQAEGHVKAKRLTTPAGKNARETYRRVLELDAGNTQAQAGLERIAQEYLQQAQQRRLAWALQDCLELIDKGLAVVPDQAELLRLREAVRAEWVAEQQRLEQQRQSEQQKEQQRKEQQRLEQQRQSEQQQKEQQRKEQQRQEEKQRQEQQRKLEQQQQQEEKQQQEQQRKLEQQRLEQQRLEQQRKEQQRLEQQRREEKQRQEQQRKLEQQRLDQQRLEQQRKEQQRLEQQRREEKQWQEQQRKLEQRQENPQQKPTQPETTTIPRIFGTF